MATWSSWSLGQGPERRLAGLASSLIVLLAVGGCAETPTPTGSVDIVEFSAEGTSGTAFGSYVLVGDLLSTGARSFSGLPFSARVSAPGTISPKMSVSVVDVPPNSRVTCRITLNDEVLVQRTGDVPGRDVVCIAPETI